MMECVVLQTAALIGVMQLWFELPFPHDVMPPSITNASSQGR